MLALTGNVGCHVLQYPSGAWGFVGSVPVTLTYSIPADTSAVLGCRAYRAEDGSLRERKVFSFDSEAEARAKAAEYGVTLAN